jgi:hypothetical protein
MHQDDVILLLFKITLISGTLSVAAFAVCYHLMTRGAVWRNEIGRTIIIKDILLVLMLTPSILSFFWHFSRLSSHVAAWVDIGLFGLLTPVMLWRIAVWRRIHTGKAGTAGGAGEP